MTSLPLLRKGVRSDPLRRFFAGFDGPLTTHRKRVYNDEGGLHFPTMSRKKSTKELLRIGDLASATGTTLRTLHYYEELGLIRPAKRTAGGFRLYEPCQLERLQLIQELRALGLELAQIKELFKAQEVSKEQGSSPMRQAVERELRRVKSLVFRFSQLRNDLDATLDILKDCENRSCPRTPGGSYCPTCQVLRDRPYVPRTFLRTSSDN